MKKIVIRIQYKGETFSSDVLEANESQEFTAKQMLKSAADGEVEHMSIKSGNIEYFFPKEIIKQSILSLFYYED
jgi:hypothetical protein